MSEQIQIDDDNFVIEEQLPDHHYRTEFPNIVFELGLSCTQLAIYLMLKRIAGDCGRCWKSKKNLSIDLGISEKCLKTNIVELTKKFDLLEGCPLIKITERKKPDGSFDSSLISIINIWSFNGNHYRKKSQKITQGGGVNFTGGVGQNLPGGGVNFTPKEEQRSLEELYKDRDITESSLSGLTESSLPVTEKVSESLPFSNGKEERQRPQKRKTQEDWVAELTTAERQFHDIAISWTAPNGESLDSAFLTANLKKFGLSKMERAWDYCLWNIPKNGIKKSFGGMFRDALNKQLKAPDVDHEQNVKFTKEISVACKDLKITEKYASIPSMHWEIYFNAPFKEFKKSLYEKVRNWRILQGLSV